MDSRAYILDPCIQEFTFKRILLHRTILSKKGYKAAEAFTNVIAYFLVKKIASWIFIAEIGLLSYFSSQKVAFNQISAMKIPIKSLEFTKKNFAIR